MDLQLVIDSSELLCHHFIDYSDEPSEEIVLDFDGIDLPVHGDYSRKFSNA